MYGTLYDADLSPLVHTIKLVKKINLNYSDGNADNVDDEGNLKFQRIYEGLFCGMSSNTFHKALLNMAKSLLQFHHPFNDLRIRKRVEENKNYNIIENVINVTLIIIS
jgi:hydrogenase maturation factor